MMKNLTLLFLVVIMGISWAAAQQSCTPNPMYQDSTGFVYPPPFDSLLNPEGGIDVIGCEGSPYEFQWTIIVPPSVNLPGIPFPLTMEYLQISTTNGITGLPNGLSYACNPPDCKFLVSQLGCVVIYGTPASGSAGVYDLQFEGILKTPLASFPVSFPDPNLFPGNYFLTILEPNDPECLSSVKDPTLTSGKHVIFPNPVHGQANLKLNAPFAGLCQITVYNAIGQQLKYFTQDVVKGENILPLSLEELSGGMYYYQIHVDGRILPPGIFFKAGM